MDLLIRAATWGYQTVAPIIEKGLVYYSREIQKASPNVLKGMTSSLQGMRYSFRPGQFSKWSRYFVKCLLVSLVIYGGLIFMLAPVLLIMLFLMPGTLLQLSLFVPHLAYKLTRGDSQVTSADTYESTRKHLDSSFHISDQGQQAGQSSSGQVPQGQVFTDQSKFSLRRPSILFTFEFWKSWLIGLVPIVGPILGFWKQLSLISVNLATTALGPWFREKNWPVQRQKQFIVDNYYLLLGFGLPYALVSMIPVIGAPIPVLSQSGSAFLVTRVLEPASKSKADAGSFRHEMESLSSWLKSSLIVNYIRYRAAEGRGIFSFVSPQVRRSITQALDFKVDNISENEPILDESQSKKQGLEDKEFSAPTKNFEKFPMEHQNVASHRHTDISS